MGSMVASNLMQRVLEVCDSICNAFLYNNNTYDEIDEEGWNHQVFFQNLAYYLRNTTPTRNIKRDLRGEGRHSLKS